MKIDRQRTCSFSGHRKIRKSEIPLLKFRLQNEISSKIISENYVNFLCGGAVGFDTLAAEIIIELKYKFPNIRLFLILPCHDQARYWSHTDRQRYENIKKFADSVLYIEKHYTPSCMFQRNRFLIDHSSVCICYLSNLRSGTAYTVNYAQKSRLKIINLFSV